MNSIMTIRAPDELKAFLNQSAKNWGLTTNGLVLQILWEWKATHSESPALSERR